MHRTRSGSLGGAITAQEVAKKEPRARALPGLTEGMGDASGFAEYRAVARTWNLTSPTRSPGTFKMGTSSNQALLYMY